MRINQINKLLQIKYCVLRKCISVIIFNINKLKVKRNVKI